VHLDSRPRPTDETTQDKLRFPGYFAVKVVSYDIPADNENAVRFLQSQYPLSKLQALMLHAVSQVPSLILEGEQPGAQPQSPFSWLQTSTSHAVLQVSSPILEVEQPGLATRRVTSLVQPKRYLISMFKNFYS